MGETPGAALFAAERDHLGAWDGTRKVFFHDGRVPLHAGDIAAQPRPGAAACALIGRDGAKAFYDGPIGAAIVAEAKAHGGLITAADLKNYKVVERVPVRGHYRGYEIVSMPPPSSGGVHVVQILNILSNFPLRDWGHNSAKTIHVMAEAEKRAYADRSEYLGDPDFVKVPVKGLTSPDYAKELAGQIDLGARDAVVADQARPPAALRERPDHALHRRRRPRQRRQRHLHAQHQLRLRHRRLGHGHPAQQRDGRLLRQARRAQRLRPGRRRRQRGRAR